MRLIAALVLMTSASSVTAQEWRWEDFPQPMNSAELAATGWQLIATAGVAQPDEYSRIATFWTGTLNGVRVTARCLTSIRGGEFSENETCELPVAGD